jgi:hypothetical protein
MAQLVVELNTVQWLEDLPDFVRHLSTLELEGVSLNLAGTTIDFWMAVADAVRVELAQRGSLPTASYSPSPSG